MVYHADQGACKLSSESPDAEKPLDALDDAVCSLAYVRGERKIE